MPIKMRLVFIGCRLWRKPGLSASNFLHLMKGRNPSSRNFSQLSVHGLKLRLTNHEDYGKSPKSRDRSIELRITTAGGIIRGQMDHHIGLQTFPGDLASFLG